MCESGTQAYCAKLLLNISVESLSLLPAYILLLVVDFVYTVYEPCICVDIHDLVGRFALQAASAFALYKAK